MNDFAYVIQATVDLFKHEFTIYGYTFSFWNVFLFVIIAGIALAFIGGLFHD